MKRIAHLINPVSVDAASDLFTAQPITFRSMRLARRFSNGNTDVSLLSTCYPDDRSLVPPFFASTPDLTNSVMDVGTFGRPRRLPLLRDLFARLYDASEGADYVIYSNVDIAVMPFFYDTVCKYIARGCDGLMINRRTIPDHYKSPADLLKMYGETGKSHPGIDCFAMKRDLLPLFDFQNACVGTGPVGMIIAANLLANAQRSRWLENTHLTFHIGNDRSWDGEHLADYQQFNFGEYRKVLLALLDREPADPSPHVANLLRGLLECCDGLAAALTTPDNPEEVVTIKRRSKKLVRLFCKEKFDELAKVAATD